MGDIMKLVCQVTIGGNTSLQVVTTPAGNQGLYVRSIVKAGNPFWIWPSVPPGKVIAANFEDAPICTDDIAQNNILISSITTSPEAVLTYQPVTGADG